ncbi:GNAT family N-acetyltransferase [Candidatus Enterococcus murrayae]|uniref:GNAT family N-acetyltransferase n=1 Tax=Candidatus Enterococcus murrayae TaxID=2815321 RepID=A0ABS3HJE4_9ENTE|nr:GNAT family N-acetyltransferase [Enterococcus sp. MJM16]MBO0453044.1 GNAT family N-acetyltransferase [Enterococcus sp. MJM16]
MIKLIETVSRTDLETIASIWLKSNLDAHDFIEKSYWLHNYPVVKAMLPKAKLFVYYQHDEIIGFLGMVDDFIAGIFVLSEYRSLGIGTQLLNKVKTSCSHLSLSVYSKNESAVRFYLKHGFKALKKQTDHETNEAEWLMEWTA